MKTSLLPSSGVVKPNPFASLNHFTLRSRRIEQWQFERKFLKLGNGEREPLPVSASAEAYGAWLRSENLSPERLPSRNQANSITCGEKFKL